MATALERSESVMYKLFMYKPLHDLNYCCFPSLYILGHGAKPHSSEYLSNIEFVDAQIKKFVSVVEKFYAHDGATAYVMTAVSQTATFGVARKP